MSAILFLFITVNDSLWFRDIHMLNTLTSGRDTQPWQPVNPIYNQAYITGSRSVADALRDTNMTVMRLNVVKHLFEYWPYSTANSALAAETYLSLGNIGEAEYWANRTVETEPADTYLGEFYLMEIMQQKGDIEGLRTLYESLKSKPESSLSKNSNTYNILHSMAINLQDYGMVTYFYDKFVEYHGEFAPVVANQAIFYFNTSDYANAITYMSRTIELNPNHPYAEQFRQLIDEYSAALGQ